ncbi:MAG: hypothetical protein NC343_04565 [Muribaculum sp.]|nr:hypothetical protein [Muribaculaceae bacterium]MCM1081004.1 hypothetical protein [Muribaculum sp.]
MKTILCAIILVLAAFLMLGVKVLFVKGGKFPSSHVHDNPRLRSRGFSCAADHQQKENEIDK